MKKQYLGIFHILFKCVIDVQHCQMITVDVSEAHLGFVGGLFGFQRTHEYLRDCILMKTMQRDTIDAQEMSN